MEIIAIAAAVALVAAFVQGVVGFGFGLVSMALLPLWIPVDDAVPIVAVFCLMVNGSLLVQLRRNVRARDARPLLLGGLAGIPLGVLFLDSAAPTLLRAVLGVLLVGYVALSLLRRQRGRAPVEASNRWGLLAGFSGGLLGAAFNTGGPPAVLYVAAKPSWPPAVVKANLQAFFVMTSVVQLSMFAATGILSTEHLAIDAGAIPMAVLGAWLGNRASASLDKQRFHSLLLIALALLGGSFLLRAALG